MNLILIKCYIILYCNICLAIHLYLAADILYYPLKLLQPNQGWQENELALLY